MLLFVLLEVFTSPMKGIEVKFLDFSFMYTSQIFKEKKAYRLFSSNTMISRDNLEFKYSIIVHVATVIECKPWRLYIVS